jgi:Na+-driven multidrug efflux pump
MPEAPAAPAPSRGELARRILALAAPTTLGSAVQSACMLAETWLAARQGTTALAGWAVVLPFSLLLGMMSAGAMGGGVSSAIARALGAKRPEEASALVLHAIIIALVFAAGFILPLAIFPRTVLGAIGGAEAAEAAAAYAMWSFGAGAIPAWLLNVLASVLRGGGRHALATRAQLAAWLLYPPLAFLLMEPAGFGLAGLGMAFALCMAAGAAGMAVQVLRGMAGFQPHLGVALQPALFWRILSVGGVACIMATISNLTTILVTARIKAMGPAAVAAYGVSARLEFLMIPLAFGVGAALTAMVGRAVGGGDWLLARRIAWVGTGMALCVTVPVAAFVALAPATTAAFFTHDPAVQEIAIGALGIVGPAMPFFGGGMALYFASIGAARMGHPVLAGLARIAVAVGGGWWLAEGLGWGLDGQLLGVALGIIAFGLINAVGVRPGVWRARGMSGPMTTEKGKPA